ncbi:erythromycin esterase family protein [Aquiflexum sp.]|uniref:erythromycin esterase family protein n=1 Tax=Aquiflexum sp. TaxID=1872584 RepID=UPI0035945287
MKKSLKILLMLNSLMFGTICFGQEAAQENENAIISWIQENAIPINHVEAGNGFEDLQPLKEILKDVKVVGLGEATHGTREFFQIKHRLLEFLLKEMGFTGFAMEASYSACKPINDYVLFGKGDIYEVLTGQGYVPWDTEEMIEMIEWMRAYNENVVEERMVKFYGVDLAYQDIGRKEVLAYLEKVAPEMRSQADSIFKILANEEGKWPIKIDSLSQNIMLHAFPNFQNLMDDLLANKETFIKNSSPYEFDQALQNLRVMRQFMLVNTPGLHPPFMDGGIVRSISMAANLIYLMDQAGPEAKFVIWAHNSHIAKDVWNGDTIMGYELRKKYGDAYYALSLEMNQGSYQTRTFLPPNLLGDLKSLTIPPAPVVSWPWYLAQANVANILLDFRGASKTPELETWVNAPRNIFLAGWVHEAEPKLNYTELEMGRLYDGILYIQTTNPSRPTANALKSAAERKGL